MMYNTAHEGISRPQLDLGLTSQQQDVVAFYAKGLTVPEMAADLCLSTSGVARTMGASGSTLGTTSHRQTIQTAYGLDRTTFDTGLLERYELPPQPTKVFYMILRGYPNAQIAQRLRLSQSTVWTHTKRVFSTLDAVNRLQLTALAHGLLDTAEPVPVELPPVHDAVRLPQDNVYGLENTECNILSLIVQGVGNEGMRRSLGVPRRQLFFRRDQAMKKLEASNHMHAVATMYNVTPDPFTAVQSGINRQLFRAIGLAMRGWPLQAIAQHQGMSLRALYVDFNAVRSRLGANSLAHMAAIVSGLVELPGTD